MAHAHDHDHSHDENYFLDQVSTVAVCGLIAGLGFLGWKVGLFREYNILTDQFNLMVLCGSLALAAVVVVRGASLWKEAGRRNGHAHGHHHHDHEHGHGHHHHHHEHGEHCDHHHGPGETCDHDHGHDHHQHRQSAHERIAADHGHEHGFAPWRYAVLLLPLMLSGLLLYYKFTGLELTYSKDRIFAFKVEELEAGEATIKAGKGGVVLRPGLRELMDAARSPGLRDYWEGRSAELRGILRPVSDREFTVVRMKMTCCGADAVPMNVRIFAPDSLSRYGTQPGKGVTVVGQVEFRKVKDRDEYVPVVFAKEIRPTELGNDIFDKG